MNPATSPTSLIPGPRIAVIGVSGSGKTTLAARLSTILSIPHVELDALHWLPGWVEQEREQFRQSVAQALYGSTWVVDGNYSKARDIIWGRASTIVWLDYPLPVILWQLTSRTLKRMVTHEKLWGGNVETFRGAFFSKESLFLWALKTYRQRRVTYPPAFARPEHAHLQVIQLHSRADTAAWLELVQQQVTLN